MDRAILDKYKELRQKNLGATEAIEWARLYENHAIVASWGDSFEDTANFAIKLAKECNRPMPFLFNGITCTANAGSTLLDMINLYRSQL